MIGQMKKGEDIEHYADKHEERDKALREQNLLDGIDVVGENGNWITGYAFGEFSFDAKVYPEPSADFGIVSHGADGHISKLTVKKEGNIVFNYDRGFDFSLMPEDDEIDLIEAIELYVKNEFSL